MYQISFFCVQILIWTTLAENKLPGSRIISGQSGGPARAAQFPYAAALEITKSLTKSDSILFCGGSLLSNRWLLTAAHCVESATEIKITLGSTSLTQDDSNRELLSSNTYFLHPDFNKTTLENDIALVKLRATVMFNDYIGKLHLPVNDYNASVNVTTFGWGQASDYVAGNVDSLNYVNLVTISNQECQLFFGPSVIDTMICAAGQYNEGICTGDSGGALVYLLNNRHPIAVGVASFHGGFGCERPEPSGFIRVFPNREWILTTTGDLTL